MLAKLAGKRPVFEYGSITDEIEDPNLTFEQLRVKMSADCPELEARSHVSWTMSYAGSQSGYPVRMQAFTRPRRKSRKVKNSRKH